MMIPVASIVIDARQRKVLDQEELVALAESIERWGLLNPITLDDENHLIAGYRRTMAHILLGREEIEYRVSSDLDSIEKKELELEENIRRVNLEWQEEAEAIAEIHSMKKKIDPEWSVAKTAELVGKSSGQVSMANHVVEAAKTDPSVYSEGSILSASNKIRRKRKVDERIALSEKGGADASRAQVLQGDALDLILTTPSESFDAVITNFPFGVELTFKSGENPYDDDETIITDLVRMMVPEIYRVLKEDRWFVGFFDIRKICYNQFSARAYKEARSYLSGEALNDLERGMGLKFWLEEAGFSYVSMIPAIWVKPNKTQGIVGSADRGMIAAYEAFVIAAKGDPVLNVQGKQNIFIYDSLKSSERDFSVEMPADLCEELVRMVCFGGSRVLDPFAGSGAMGIGALRRECTFLGFELNEERARLANTKLAEAMKGIDDAALS